MLCQGNMFPLRHGAFEALKFGPLRMAVEQAPPKKRGGQLHGKTMSINKNETCQLNISCSAHCHETRP